MNIDLEVWQTVGVIAGTLAGVATVVILTVKLILFLWRLGRDARNFFADWKGTPARPGVDAEPGVMERLKASEAHDAETNTRLTNLERHVGNGDKVTLREVVIGNTKSINDILGVIGTRELDTKRETLADYLPPKPKKGTVKE